MELPKISTGSLIGGAAAIVSIGALGTAAAIISSNKKSRKRKHKNKNTRARVHRHKKLKFGSKAYRKKYLKHNGRRQKHPYTAGRRKDTSHKRIRFTKNNQPYIIKSDGRARFISKKQVHNYRSRKGGRY